MIHRTFALASAFCLAATVIGIAAFGQGQQTPPPGQRGQAPAPAPAGGQGRGGRGAGPITIRAARVIDGRGGMLENAVITVQGTKIVSVSTTPPAGPITYDLGNVTLMPGLIDVHVHLQWYFGPGGKYAERNLPAGYETDAVIENARATLMGGFTTVQSVGWAGDKPLRAAIAAGTVNGPRLVTSLGPVSGTPDQLRELVRQRKTDGADLIKYFASASVRDGGKMNVTQEQLDAVCGEAKTLGLRVLVHAHDSPSIVASVKAGCTQIEHGLFADDAAIKAMADTHTYFDPNIGLVLQNYLEHHDEYDGTSNFNEASFAAMFAAIPRAADVFKRALAAGLKMPMGTDAVAGAHGHNAREIVTRVNSGGQKPMDAIIGATSLSAASMNLGTTIGTLAPNFEADIIAVTGNPLTDISMLRSVAFVMKGGKVFKK